MRGMYRSRTFRRVKVKTPGGRVVTHYERRKPKKAHCGNCKTELQGIPRALPWKMQRLQKTKKRPERPYGGSLCSKCTRELIKDKTRAISKAQGDLT